MLWSSGSLCRSVEWRFGAVVVLVRGGEGELARRPKKPVLAGAGAGCTAGAGSLWPKRPMMVVDVKVREGMGNWDYGKGK
jgi:hypothetical protein